MTHLAPPRYAVYYALPRDNGLWRLAQSWLGRDCETGEDLAQPGLEGWTAADVAALTASPRRYGFHATLKPPFHLAPGISIRHLHDSLAGFAAGQQPFEAPPLEVSAIGPFLALVLSKPSAKTEALAAAAVTELDHLRAPLDQAEIQHRLAPGLTARQEQLLRRWGYPFVLDEFRFHMTLTGPIPDADLRQRLQTRLAALFAPQLAGPVPVREICLYSQATRDQPFALVERFGFGAVTAEAEPKAKAGQAQS